MASIHYVLDKNMSRKADKDIFKVLDKNNQIVEGLKLEKENANYRVFQDGYYAGKLDKDLAKKLRLIPLSPK